MEMPFAWLAAVIVVAQPIVLLVGSGCYTEPLFAACLVWGLVFWLEERFIPSALLLGWTALTRLEGILMLPLFAAMFAIRKRWVPILLLWLPFAVWAGLSAIFSGDLLWIKNSVPYRIHQYGDLISYPGHYGRELIKLMGPPLFAAALIGAVSLWRYWGGAWWVIAGAFYFLIQEAAFTFAYGSAGYTRFLVGASPVFSVMALAGIVELLGWRCKQRSVAVAAGVGWVALLGIGLIFIPDHRTAALLASVCFLIGMSLVILLPRIFKGRYKEVWDNHRAWHRGAKLAAIPALTGLFLVFSILPYAAAVARPLGRQPLDRSCRELAKLAQKEITASGVRPRFCSSLYRFYEGMEVNPFDLRQATPYFNTTNVLAAEPGTLILWDGFFGGKLYHVPLEVLEDRNAFELVGKAKHRDGSPDLRLYRKR